MICQDRGYDHCLHKKCNRTTYNPTSTQSNAFPEAAISSPGMSRYRLPAARQRQSKYQQMKGEWYPETHSASSNGIDETEEREAKRRRQMDQRIPSLKTSFRVDSRYGTEPPAKGNEDHLGDIQEACVIFHDGMREMQEECRQRATEDDLMMASRIEQVMAMLNGLTNGTNVELETSKRHAVCATCMMQKSFEWMCDPGPVIWDGAEKLVCCACRANAVIKLAFSFAACVKKRLTWGLKEQYNMRVLGMLQVVAYEHYTDAVQNRERTQQEVKKKWEKLMIENS